MKLAVFQHMNGIASIWDSKLGNIPRYNLFSRRGLFTFDWYINHLVKLHMKNIRMQSLIIICYRRPRQQCDRITEHGVRLNPRLRVLGHIRTGALHAERTTVLCYEWHSREIIKCDHAINEAYRGLFYHNAPLLSQHLDCKISGEVPHGPTVVELDITKSGHVGPPIQHRHSMRMV